MATRDTIGGGDKTAQATAQNKYENIRDYYLQVKAGMQAKLEALTPTQRDNAITALVNWNVGAANPTVGRENALYAGLALLYMVVFFLVLRVLKD